MSGNLRQSLVNVLSALSKHQPDDILELHRLMEDTTLSPFRKNVERAIAFHKKSAKWPDFKFIADKLEGFIPDPSKGGSDFLTNLKFDLQDEFFQTEALDAANASDWARLENLVFKKAQLSARKFVPYTAHDSFEEYERMEGNVNGIELGVTELDDVLRGISFKSTAILAAPPSMFKTSAAISATFHNAFRKGMNVLYVSMEVPKRNIWFQILSRLSVEPRDDGTGKMVQGKRLIAEDVKKVKLDAAGKERFKELRDIWKKEATGSLHVADQSDLGDGSYRSLLAMLNSVNEHLPEGEEIHVVIWDYIQLFKFFRMPGQTEIEYLNGLVRYTDSLCKTYRERGFVNIILSQVNRQGQLKIARKNRADLTLLAEINELERSANSVTVFYSDEAMRLDNQLNAQVVKHRDGKVMEEMESIFVDPEVSQVGTGGLDFDIGMDDLDLLGPIGGGDEAGDLFM